jgi:hypothetical protein
MNGIKTILEFKDQFAFLSNFYYSPITQSFSFTGVQARHLPIASNIVYPTVEHAYQANKTNSYDERVIISELHTPGQAKRYGRQYLTLTSDWNIKKTLVMQQLLELKFVTHPYLANLLLNTGTTLLQEGNVWNDRFWGVCVGADGVWQGENHLGKLLMLVRDDIRTGRLEINK